MFPFFISLTLFQLRQDRNLAVAASASAPDFRVFRGFFGDIEICIDVPVVQIIGIVIAQVETISNKTGEIKRCYGRKDFLGRLLAKMFPWMSYVESESILGSSGIDNSRLLGKRSEVYSGPNLRQRLTTDPRLFMEHVDKGFQPGVFVRSQPGFS